MYLVTIATSHGIVSQRSELTASQRHILSALELAEPSRFFDFPRRPTRIRRQRPDQGIPSSEVTRPSWRSRLKLLLKDYFSAFDCLHPR